MAIKNFFHQLVTVRAIPEFKDVTPNDASFIVESARKSKDLKPSQNWMIIVVALVFSIPIFGHMFIFKLLSMSLSKEVLLLFLFVAIVYPYFYYVFLRTLRPQILRELVTLKNE